MDNIVNVDEKYTLIDLDGIVGKLSPEAEGLYDVLESYQSRHVTSLFALFALGNAEFLPGRGYHRVPRMILEFSNLLQVRHVGPMPRYS